MKALLLVAACLQPIWIAAAATNPFALSDAIREVLSSNPSLKAARANWDAMKERVPQARAWEDLTFGVDVERSDRTQLFRYTDTEWTVAQEFPLSGKNRKRAKAVVAEAAAAFEELRRRELDLTTRTRAAYYRLANSYEQLDVSRQNEALLRQFLEISRARYEVGRQTQADVLMAETELVKLIEARVDIEQQLSEQESALNVLMNRRASEPVGRPARLLFLPSSPNPDASLQLALKSRPELLAAQQRLQAARARWELAKREWVPDPELRVEARQFNGQGAAFQEYDTGIFFKIPWINRSKYKAAIAEMRSMLEMAEQQLQAEQNETAGRIRDQLKKIETLHHHTQLFQERLLPLARQAVKAQQNAYETDKAGFLELSTSQRTLQETEAMYWHHLTEYLTALAELEAIIGTELKYKAP
jgi:outer membrane protein, heavy metal efflux system